MEPTGSPSRSMFAMDTPSARVGFPAPSGGPERAVSGLSAAGTSTFVVTAIERDGLLGGPDLELLGAMVASTTPR